MEVGKCARNKSSNEPARRYGRKVARNRGKRECNKSSRELGKKVCKKSSN